MFDLKYVNKLIKCQIYSDEGQIHIVNTKYTFNSVTMYTESNINHQKYEMTDLHKVSTFESILDQVILRDCNESYLRQIKYSFD